MAPVITPCTNQIVSVLLGTQCIQCVWLEETAPTTSGENLCVKAYHKQTFATPITFTQPATIEHTIRSFLTEHTIPNAFVAMALTPDNTHDQQNISAHQLLQCQLLAINTPFHCAGITTHQLAQEHANQKEITLAKTYHAVASPDLLCSIGLYIMARKQTT